jgi:hypothetical protein
MPSEEARPIEPAAFAAAIKDLPVSTLQLKAVEIRNSIAHLDYSNEQLKPFTEGPERDEICIESIAENEAVLARQAERLALLREEVERRGLRWTDVSEAMAREGNDSRPSTNGVASVDAEQGHNVDIVSASSSTRHVGDGAWADGTLSTGRLVNGELVMDPEAGRSRRSADEVNGVADSAHTTGEGRPSGTLSDEELRRLETLHEEAGRGVYL